MPKSTRGGKRGTGSQGRISNYDYWSGIGQSARQGISEAAFSTSADRPPLIISDYQFGKKVGKHANVFGLDPKKEEDRIKFGQITSDIYNNPDEIRRGKWRGQQGDVSFYIKGNDVVVVNSGGEYITTLKDGVNNANVKRAEKI